MASSTFCLLIRGPKYWDLGFPEALVYLFQFSSLLDEKSLEVGVSRRPGTITLGFGFDQTDQEKLNQSFGWSMEDFANFVDVQALAGKCGYPADSSLSTLASKILGIKSTFLSPTSQKSLMYASRMHADPSFLETDWEVERLRSSDAFFASLSVFAIGQIFRQLRHWHALPKRCSTCRQELGPVTFTSTQLPSTA